MIKESVMTDKYPNLRKLCKDWDKLDVELDD